MVREDKEAMVAATGSVNSQSGANAHLIAAAPDMYAMLNECLQVFEGCNEYMEDEITDLLVKARGEQ